MPVINDLLYDVVIFEIASRKVDAVIGERLRRWDGSGRGYNTAELRQQTGRERVNERYDAKIVPAGKFQKGDTLP